MAAAFNHAGFEATDVHMQDIIEGRVGLSAFHGLAACGGFSYGDVMGGGRGWANSILFNARARESFQEFFSRGDSFTLGVCNGCQMLAQLSTLIPGAAHWPTFTRNRSEQFEARLVMVEIEDSPSVLLADMAGARIPIVVAHGEGYANYADANERLAALDQGTVAMRFVDNSGRATEKYPANPNGSPDGITGLTSTDGRVTIMMPHPERVFIDWQLSWLPSEWKHANTPWLRMFENARRWLA